jgi:hypothetical protein
MVDYQHSSELRSQNVVNTETRKRDRDPLNNKKESADANVSLVHLLVAH